MPEILQDVGASLSLKLQEVTDLFDTTRRVLASSLEVLAGFDASKCGETTVPFAVCGVELSELPLKQLCILGWSVTGLGLIACFLLWFTCSIFHRVTDFPMRDRQCAWKGKASNKRAQITLRGGSVRVDPEIKDAVENGKPQIIRKKMKEIDPTIFDVSLFWSLFYFVMDYAILLGLYKLRVEYEYLLDGKPEAMWWGAYFLWINLVGFEMWALFVVGHDCGHYTFCKSKSVGRPYDKFINNFFGHIAHTPIMVPFHGWRISHRTHHKYHSNLEKDESHVPIEWETFDKMNFATRLMRFTPIMLIGFLVYVLGGGSWNDKDTRFTSNHFNPNSRVVEQEDDSYCVLMSDIWYIVWCWCLWKLCGGDWRALCEWYFVPILVFHGWVVVVTYLHHTGPESVYYHNDKWNFVKGQLTSYDRRYGCLGLNIIDFFMHNISLHTVHHMFFLEVPHYNLVKGTKVYRQVMGDELYAQQDMTHEYVFKTLMDSMASCNVLNEAACHDEAGGVMYAEAAGGVWNIGARPTLRAQAERRRG